MAEFYDNDLTPAADGEWDFLFVSALRDGISRLSLLRFRQFSSSLGFFVSRDPLRRTTIGFYRYGASTPVNQVDPYGLAEKCLEKTLRKGVWDDDIIFDDLVVVFEWTGEVCCDDKGRVSRISQKRNDCLPIDPNNFKFNCPAPDLVGAVGDASVTLRFQIMLKYDDFNYSAGAAGAGTGAAGGAAFGAAFEGVGALPGAVVGGIGGGIVGLNQGAKYDGRYAEDWDFTCSCLDNNVQITATKVGSAIELEGDMYLGPPRYNWYDPVPTDWPEKPIVK